MKERLRKIFGCDLRSLAVFRVALALLIFYDVAHRFPQIEAFYSDAGFFSIDYAQDESPFSYSLNYLSGSVAFQQSLFILLFVAAIALAAGWMTQVATLICWLLLISIHVRNPFVLIGGDTLLRLLLFWSLFIPLGKVWSLDQLLFRRQKKNRRRQPADLVHGAVQLSTHSTSNPNLLATVGTACLIFQVCIMYWCAGISKLTEPWMSGTAMEYVWRLSLYVRPLAEWALTQPFLIKSIAYSTLLIELAAPFLLFLPFWTDRFRILTILIFLGLHVGIELTLDVGNFGIVSAVAWIPLIPGCVWNQCCCRKNPANETESKQKVCLSVKNSSANKNLAANESIPGDSRETPNSNPAASNQPVRFGWVQSVVPILFLVYIVLWNYAGLYVLHGTRWQLNLSPEAQRVGWVTMIAQNFQMFGDPPRFDPTFVFSGRLANGQEVDLIRHHPANQSRPDQEGNNAVSEQWRMVHRFLLRHPGNKRFHQALLDYYTDVWNKDHPESAQVMESSLECYYEQLGPDYQEGSFVRRPDLAVWKSGSGKPKEAGEKSEEDLLQDVDSFFQGLDPGPIDVNK